MQAALYRARIKALIAGDTPPGDHLMSAYEDEAEWRPEDDTTTDDGSASASRVPSTAGGGGSGSSRFTAGGATLSGDESSEAEVAR